MRGSCERAHYGRSRPVGRRTFSTIICATTHLLIGRVSQNLAHLLSLSPSNRTIFTTITQSAFAVSLDNYAYSLPALQRTSDPDLTAHLHNIRSGHGNRPGHNRWYDKAFTLIVEANARAGVLGEHSPVDALVPSIVADYAIVQGVDEDAFPSALGAEASSTQEAASGSDEEGHVEGWERLDWVVDGKIEAECADAARRAKAIVDDSDNDELVFDAYGVDWIKNEGTHPCVTPASLAHAHPLRRPPARLPPDAYIQMALQLAWYRTRGEFTATYETALTRLFKHGRTETIRTLSTDARAWVLSMADPSASVSAVVPLPVYFIADQSSSHTFDRRTIERYASCAPPYRAAHALAVDARGGDRPRDRPAPPGLAAHAPRGRG